MNDVELGSGLTRVKMADGEFSLDLIEASRELNVIIRDCESAGMSNFEYVDRFGQWICGMTGVTLRPGQTYQLIKAINAAFAEGKEPAAPPPA